MALWYLLTVLRNPQRNDDLQRTLRLWARPAQAAEAAVATEREHGKVPLREERDVHEIARWASDVAENSGLRVAAFRGERKAARRQYIEDLIAWWLGYTAGDLGSVRGEDAGGLLDFLTAAVRPILVGGDQLGDGNWGRDTLRKIVGDIRSSGFFIDRMTKSAPRRAEL